MLTVTIVKTVVVGEFPIISDGSPVFGGQWLVVLLMMTTAAARASDAATSTTTMVVVLVRRLCRRRRCLVHGKRTLVVRVRQRGRLSY